MISFDSYETSSWNLLFAFIWDNAKTFAWRQSLNNFPIFVPNLEIQENKYGCLFHSLSKEKKWLF